MCPRPSSARLLGAGASHRRRRIAAVRKGSRLAEGPVEVEDGIRVRRRDRRAGPRVDPQSPTHARESAVDGARPEIHGRAARDGVRQRGQLHPGLGRGKRAGISMAVERARPHRGFQGLRVGRGQRGRQAEQSGESPERQPDSQVHEGRQIRDGHRQERPDRQQQDRGPEGRDGPALLRQDQRAVRHRRLRQQPRHGVRRGHGKVQAHVGRVWQQAAR